MGFTGPCSNECAGDFNRAFTEILPRLQRAAVSLTGCPGRAEDVVHDAYLRIARSPERFLRHPQPYAYAFTTMVNLVRDQWRRERRRALLPDAAEEPVGADRIGEVQSCWEVVRLLRRLTAKQARVVLLVDLDGYSLDEAAALLGVHRSTLAVTRRRALGRLRVILEGERASERDRECERRRERHGADERAGGPEQADGPERADGPGRHRPDAPN
ncbi:RNA polymerase sigma factor [Kitasatospora sp. NPDC048239]|uniref:RNA polymerase sigma factor n=1 Tax=Kitasatospora sp. NPDC048239 TaxID=3364046 RepID=UPI00371EB582